MAKWTLYDGTTTFQFSFSPVAMTSPNPTKDLTTSTLQLQTVMNPTKAAQWTFNGNLYSDAEKARFILWHQKEQVLTLTDHLGRSWKVISQTLNIQDRQSHKAQRYTYSWQVLNLGPA